MFPHKERHWITGKYEHSIGYDNWNQWIETMLYKTWTYFPLLWNIKDIDVENDKYSLQILYYSKDGELKITCIFMSVSSKDEAVIQAWINEQQWITN